MASQPPQPGSGHGEDDLWLEWFKPRRWVQFFRRVVTVEGSIEALKGEVTVLHAQVNDLQLQVNTLQAHIRVLLPTLHGTVDDKVRIAILETVPALVERELERRKNA